MYRILIVDDEKRERDGLEKLIRKYRYPLEILQASDGEEALELFKKQRIEILLTDIKMPFMTGIELIEEVRKRGYMPFCIIFSAYGEFEYAQNAIALGVIQYLLKPISMDDFQKLFEKVLKLCKEQCMIQKSGRGSRNERSRGFRNLIIFYLQYWKEKNSRNPMWRRNLQNLCFMDGNTG